MNRLFSFRSSFSLISNPHKLLSSEVAIAAGAKSKLLQKRFLNLHEFQSKALLKRSGLNVQRGGVASSSAEAFSSEFVVFSISKESFNKIK